MLENSYPRRFNVAGNIHFTMKKDDTAVIRMDDQLPKFKAVCTFDFSSLIVTNQVPIIEKIIPNPQITMGNKIGDMPPKLSCTSISWPNTMVARIVAT